MYTLHSGEPEELISGISYVKYAVSDLNGDELEELVVLRSDQDGNGLADYYCWQEGTLQPRISARITSTMAELSQQGRVKNGTLADGTPALFVTGVEESSVMATDILAVRNEELVNILLSDVTGVTSEVAPFCALYPEDINGDSVTEVPHPVATAAGAAEDDSASHRIDWYAFSSDATSSIALRTYHSMEDGWYLVLPDSWIGQVMFSRTVGTDENTVTFSYRQGGTEDLREFLRISRLTGSGREARAARGGRMILRRQPEVIYTAEFLDADGGWDYAMDEEELREAFNLITTEWAPSDS